MGAVTTVDPALNTIPAVAHRPRFDNERELRPSSSPESSPLRCR
jgi:hypothetical protein